MCIRDRIIYRFTIDKDIDIGRWKVDTLLLAVVVKYSVNVDRIQASVPTCVHGTRRTTSIAALVRQWLGLLATERSWSRSCVGTRITARRVSVVPIAGSVALWNVTRSSTHAAFRKLHDRWPLVSETWKCHWNVGKLTRGSGRYKVRILSRQNLYCRLYSVLARPCKSFTVLRRVRNCQRYYYYSASV